MSAAEIAATRRRDDLTAERTFKSMRFISVGRKTETSEASMIPDGSSFDKGVGSRAAADQAAEADEQQNRIADATMNEGLDLLIKTLQPVAEQARFYRKLQVGALKKGVEAYEAMTAAMAEKVDAMDRQIADIVAKVETYERQDAARAERLAKCGTRAPMSDAHDRGRFLDESAERRDAHERFEQMTAEQRAIELTKVSLARPFRILKNITE